MVKVHGLLKIFHREELTGNPFADLHKRKKKRVRRIQEVVVREVKYSTD